jgi:adenylate kinase
MLCAMGLLSAQGNRLIVVLVGPPGAGKTTHAKMLNKEFKLPIISSEEIIRESNDRRKGELKKLKGTPLEYGEGMDDTLMTSLVRNRIMKGDCANGFILDGFPKSKEQAVEFKKMAAEMAIPATVIIHLRADDATIEKRMMARGKNYDKPEIVRERIRAYREEEAAVLGEVNKDKLVAIDGTMPEKETGAAIRAAVLKFR